ncbi:uncharacterized protein J3D65DRAFT_664846 [Phyllosticta citribraziliensis]|uniref:Uncharacterized protein n=1 Tax=Phyllosticta citribraziliensis TaxID=989973 RepID=A0ABR1M4E8_9PEZI
MATVDDCYLKTSTAAVDPRPELNTSPRFHLETSNAPVIAEWCFHEGSPTYLGCKVGNAGTKVIADIRLNSSRSTALFDIRVPVEMKAFARTTYVHILLDPANIKGVARAESIPDSIQGLFVGSKQSKTAGQVIGLEFDMTKPGSLLGPATARIPKTKKAREGFDALKSLAQVAKFTLYVPSQYISNSQAQQLSSTFTEGPHFRADWPDFKRMYGGKGAILLDWDTLETTTATVPDDNTSPPSYDEIGPAPPVPRGGKSSLKKPRDSSPEAHQIKKKVKFAHVNTSGDTEDDEEEWKRSLQEELRSLRSEVRCLRKEIRPSSADQQAAPNPPSAVPNVETQQTEEPTSFPAEASQQPPNPLETRIDTLENRINTLGDQLSRLISDTASAQSSNAKQIDDLKRHFDERIAAIEYMMDVEVHDARRDAELGLEEAEGRWEEWRVEAKAELESFVQEEMAEVEESIKRNLREAGRVGMGATVYFDLE